MNQRSIEDILEDLIMLIVGAVFTPRGKELVDELAASLGIPEIFPESGDPVSGGSEAAARVLAVMQQHGAQLAQEVPLPSGAQPTEQPTKPGRKHATINDILKPRREK